MRKPGLGKLKSAFAVLRGMFPMAPAKREALKTQLEVAEVIRHRDMVPLSPGEAHTRELMLAEALDTGSMVALAGTENRIAQMVAEQTRGFRKQLGDLEGHISTLSQRIMYLEDPARPKLGERGSGTGIFPRPRRAEPELAGRPGTLKDAVREHMAGEGARASQPSTLEAQRKTNDERTRFVEAQPMISGPEPEDTITRTEPGMLGRRYTEMGSGPREDRADLRRGDRYGGMEPGHVDAPPNTARDPQGRFVPRNR